MGNSRKSARRNDCDDLPLVFERALEAILARVCISGTDPKPLLAVAYSGGLDSSVLLCLAQQFAKARGLPLVALHVHHGLSPNADGWLQHCGSQTMRLGVSFHAARVEISRSDPQGVEQAARVARYQQLGALCHQLGVTLLLTGHHQDDQAETVFLQMARGAGLPGLSGMPALQLDSALLGGGVALARPLLAVGRNALQRTARQLQLAYVDDESNADARYRRNGVRHQLFPAIGAQFPAFSACLTRVATHMQAAQRLLDELAQADLLACTADRQGTALDILPLRELSDDRLDNLLRYWLSRQGLKLPSAARLEELRWQLLGAVDDRHPFFDFGSVRLQRVKNRIALHPVPKRLPFGTINLEWRGQTTLDVPEWGGRLVFESHAGGGLAPERLRAGKLLIRARCGSERFKPALNRPSKTLKQLFQEQAIPSRQRQRQPLVYLDGQLVLVGGIGMDARIELASPGIVMQWQAAPATALTQGQQEPGTNTSE